MAAPLKVRLWLAMLFAATLAAAGADAKADEFRLFPASPPRPRYFSDFRLDGEPGLRIVDLEHSYPWSGGGRPDLRHRDRGAARGRGPAGAAACARGRAAPCAEEALHDGDDPVDGRRAARRRAPGNRGSAAVRTGRASTSPTKDGSVTNTYAGGADKASHFVISSGVSRLLFDVYQLQGHTVDQSFNLALATTFMAGMIRGDRATRSRCTGGRSRT